MNRSHKSKRSASVTGRPAKRVKFHGEVSILLGIETMRPWAEFPLVSRPVSRHLRWLGFGWYLLVGKRSFCDDDVPSHIVRACTLVWAPDTTSALLVCGSNRDVKEKHESIKESPDLPPVDLLVPRAKNWTYRELIRIARGRIMEEAVYDFEGRYKYKVLHFSKANVYFRSRLWKNAELPFAIELN
jgi:hypothetical protein